MAKMVARISFESAMSLDRTIRWRALDPEGLEHCRVISSARDTRIRSTVITPDYGLFYRLKLEPSGEIRHARLERTDGALLELFTRLDDSHFRYQATDGSFERVIKVDDDGLVLDYPGLFTRVG